MNMWTDTQFMLTAQLSLLGIVTIFGLFFVWRAMRRIENKIDLLVERVNGQNYAIGGRQPGTFYIPNNNIPDASSCNVAAGVTLEDKVEGDNVEGTDADDAALEEIFGELGATEFSPPNMVFTAFQVHKQPDTGVAIQEITEAEPETHEPEHELAHEPTPSEVATSVVGGNGGTVSRNKLLKMNLETLKERCRALSIPDEGTKKELTERILAAAQATAEEGEEHAA